MGKNSNPMKSDGTIRNDIKRHTGHMHTQNVLQLARAQCERTSVMFVTPQGTAVGRRDRGGEELLGREQMCTEPQCTADVDDPASDRQKKYAVQHPAGQVERDIPQLRRANSVRSTI